MRLFYLYFPRPASGGAPERKRQPPFQFSLPPLLLMLKISILMGMEEKPLGVICQAQNSAEAEMLRGVLEANGVNCVLLDRNASGMVAGFGPAIPVRVAVAAEDREKALAIIKSFEYNEE